jgi:hypothetical protein
VPGGMVGWQAEKTPWKGLQLVCRRARHRLRLLCCG